MAPPKGVGHGQLPMAGRRWSQYRVVPFGSASLFMPRLSLTFLISNVGLY